LKIANKRLQISDWKNKGTSDWVINKLYLPKVNVNLFAYWVILLLLLNYFYIWPPHENMASFAAALGCIQLPVTFKKEGKHTSTRTIQVRFLVLPCDTNYNCILGRTILKLIEALVPCKTF
jgi:hypothetical protein